MNITEFWGKWIKCHENDTFEKMDADFFSMLEDYRTEIIRECVNAEKKDDMEVKIDEVYFRMECLKLAKKTKTMSGIGLDPDRCIDVADDYFRYVKNGK